MDIFNKVSELNLAGSYSINSNVFDTYLSRVQYIQKLRLHSYSTNIFLSFYKIELYERNNTYFINHKKLYYFSKCCFVLIKDIIAKTRNIVLSVIGQALSPPIESAQDFITLNLSQNIQTLKKLSFLAKCFFISPNLKFSNEIVL